MCSGNYPLMKLMDINGFYTAREYLKIKEEIDAFETHNDDVWVTGYPKSGSTWCQEMVYLLATDFNYERAKVALDIRFPLLENAIVLNLTETILQERLSPDHKVLSPFDVIEHLKHVKGKRFIKTHLPFHLLPKQIRTGQKMPKIIHIMRNPKQVAASYYFFSTEVWKIFKGSLEEFVDLYINGKVLCGSYFDTVLNYWNERHRANLLILTYEEMSENLPRSIQKVANFIGKPCTEEQLVRLEHHLSFSEMKNNDSVNRKSLSKNNDVGFMRKGKVDSYKEELTPQLNKKLDEWIGENISENIKGTGLPYE